MRNCPRCLNIAVIEDGYCGHCRECTMPPLNVRATPAVAGAAACSAAGLVARITEYLEVGGLFNPEMMEHDKVRDLLIDCREALAQQPNSDVSHAAKNKNV